MYFRGFSLLGQSYSSQRRDKSQNYSDVSYRVKICRVDEFLPVMLVAGRAPSRTSVGVQRPYTSRHWRPRRNCDHWSQYCSLVTHYTPRYSSATSAHLQTISDQFSLTERQLFNGQTQNSTLAFSPVNRLTTQACQTDRETVMTCTGTARQGVADRLAAQHSSELIGCITRTCLSLPWWQRGSTGVPAAAAAAAIPQWLTLTCSHLPTCSNQPTALNKARTCPTVSDVWVRRAIDSLFMRREADVFGHSILNVIKRDIC